MRATAAAPLVAMAAAAVRRVLGRAGMTVLAVQRRANGIVMQRVPQVVMVVLATVRDSVSSPAPHRVQPRVTRIA